jgi:hypothetical protein
VLADDLTETQIRALRISVNQAAQFADWDVPLLKAELSALRLADFDLPLLGFSEAKLVQFMAGPQAPGEFREFGEDIETEHCCPSCGYRWSGRSDAGKQREGGPKEEK